jgi:hypothetical protein
MRQVLQTQANLKLKFIWRIKQWQQKQAAVSIKELLIFQVLLKSLAKARVGEPSMQRLLATVLVKSIEDKVKDNGILKP